MPDQESFFQDVAQAPGCLGLGGVGCLGRGVGVFGEGGLEVGWGLGFEAFGEKKRRKAKSRPWRLVIFGVAPCLLSWRKKRSQPQKPKKSILGGGLIFGLFRLGLGAPKAEAFAR